MIARATLLMTLIAAGIGTARADELRDYGEYLAGECTSCHKLDGTSRGIPSIVGWDVENFIATLKTYKTGERQNKAMVSVVRPLDEQQMRALAAYFASLQPK